ncbi:MAG: DUF3108 domain-containing protein [Bacteroidales bacterium]|nr:DUF3108 domain-containing protein [Bacteroidales bacterium]
MKKLTLLICTLVATAMVSQAQCPLENKAFKAGEKLEYQLYFNWQFIWLKAGTAQLDISLDTYQGQRVYRANLITKGNQRTDKYFMMRDTLTSFVTPDLMPLYYRKGAREGKRYYIDEARYTYPGNRPHVSQHFVNHEGKVRTNEYDGASCVFDMVSMLLRARSFDPSLYKTGQKIYFPMADGCQIKHATVIFRGRKNFKMDSTGITYRCLVFSFVEYKDHKEKEVVTFYITDDTNHMPVRLDLFLRFGTAKAFLHRHTNLRNPQTSIIK